MGAIGASHQLALRASVHPAAAARKAHVQARAGTRERTGEEVPRSAGDPLLRAPQALGLPLSGRPVMMSLIQQLPAVPLLHRTTNNGKAVCNIDCSRHPVPDRPSRVGLHGVAPQVGRMQPPAMQHALSSITVYPSSSQPAGCVSAMPHGACYPPPDLNACKPPLQTLITHTTCLSVTTSCPAHTFRQHWYTTGPNPQPDSAGAFVSRIQPLGSQVL